MVATLVHLFHHQLSSSTSSIIHVYSCIIHVSFIYHSPCITCLLSTLSFIIYCTTYYLSFIVHPSSFVGCHPSSSIIIHHPSLSIVIHRHPSLFDKYHQPKPSTNIINSPSNIIMSNIYHINHHIMHSPCRTFFWVFPKIRLPNGYLKMDGKSYWNPMKMDDLGVPLFLDETGKPNGF